jgi:hypothetical protein
MLIAVAVLGADCEGGDTLEPEPPDAWAPGIWSITGRGSLSACEVERFNTDSFALRVSPLEIAQDPGLNTLTLVRQPAAGNLDSFSGRVIGESVDFTLEETTRDGQTHLEFSGTATSRVDIEGRFTGTGPAGCTSKGRFKVRIDCRATGNCDSPPGRDAGLPDAAPTPPDGGPGPDAAPSCVDDVDCPDSRCQLDGAALAGFCLPPDAGPVRDAAVATDAAPDASLPLPAERHGDAGPPPGACADDTEVLADVDAFAVLAQCDGDCAASLVCLAPCVAREIPVSADCGACFLDAVVCALGQCAACSDPASAECVTCFGENCEGPFTACAGTPWP